jgi:GT2 family glycosyltransferase
MSRKSDFYTAKEKLGLLSVGDPGVEDKLQVTDTYLITLARKLDNAIKSHPELKKRLVQIKKTAGKVKSKLVPHRQPAPHLPAAEASPDIESVVSTLQFPTYKKVTASIIIPAWNKVNMTVACLKSIAEKLDDRISYEVVLVNNGSEDETSQLQDIPGIVYVGNAKNLGFVGGCNSGIDAAHGRYLVFLNNDAEVTEDWLYQLVSTIESDKKIGIVGSKIIYPNGILQEAGGIIFNDGSGLNYGKFDQAASYQYNYVRDVDYCSGASVIISAKQMREFGGFDKLYQPAYYEDTDLSFKVRKAGLRAVYQPQSVIYHIEGGTAGTNLNTGFKKYQEINRDKFLKRWNNILTSSHVDSSDYYLGRDRSGDKLALIIEQTLPTPDKDSGSVRMIAMIKGLQELGYKVTFWPNDQEKKEPYATQMQQLGIEVVYGQVDFMQFSKHYASYYDLVIMSRPEICARYINICKAHYTNAKLVYDTVDLHYVRLARQAEVETANAEALLEQSRWYKVLEMFE